MQHAANCTRSNHVDMRAWQGEAAAGVGASSAAAELVLALRGWHSASGLQPAYRCFQLCLTRRKLSCTACVEVEHRIKQQWLFALALTSSCGFPTGSAPATHCRT